MARTPTIHGQIHGNIIIIGFGSIGQAVLPLLMRHIKLDVARITVIEPSTQMAVFLRSNNIKHIATGLTRENYSDILKPLLQNSRGQAFCINLSVDVDSLDIQKLCYEHNTLYLDTVVEPWAGFYFTNDGDNDGRTNYALRKKIRQAKDDFGACATQISCCGANPGMVSWFLKQALMNIAKDSGYDLKHEPQTRGEWAGLMQGLGVKGVHVAERDTQYTRAMRPAKAFWNSWSVDGFISEGMQPAELGWGTHEKTMPKNGRAQRDGHAPSIYLEQPGAATRVRSWCPSLGAQFGLLVTHNEAISIADYYTIKKGDKVIYRPTSHYAYHPCDDAWLSLDELFVNNTIECEEKQVLPVDKIAGGFDELGVLVYGHAKNAYWFGSTLLHKKAKLLAPNQNATGLQVSSSVLAGIVYALNHPQCGVIETDEMDYREPLRVQLPYLGRIGGYYTDWHPLQGRPFLFDEAIDKTDPWQFGNILV